MTNQNTIDNGIKSTLFTMQRAIARVEKLEVKESWMEIAINENLEGMVETMNFYQSNPNDFWEMKFQRLFKQCISYKK